MNEQLTQENYVVRWQDGSMTTEPASNLRPAPDDIAEMANNLTEAGKAFHKFGDADAVEQIDMIEVGGPEEVIFVYADGSSLSITEEDQNVLTPAQLAAKRELFADLARDLDLGSPTFACGLSGPTGTYHVDGDQCGECGYGM